MSNKKVTLRLEEKFNDWYKSNRLRLGVPRSEAHSIYLQGVSDYLDIVLEDDKRGEEK